MTRRTIEIAAFLATLLIATLAVHAWISSHAEQQRLQSTLAAQKQIIDAADARGHTRDMALNATLAQIEKLKRSTQTPEQIVRDLPKYLPLPQPITLVKAASSGDGAARPRSEISDLQLGINTPEDPASPLPKTSPSLVPPAVRNPNLGSQSLDASLQPLGLTSNAATCPAPGLCASKSSIVYSASQVPSNEPASQHGEQKLTPRPAGRTCVDSSNCSAQIPAADLKPLYNYVQDCRSCQSQLAVAKQSAMDDAAKIAALTRERDAAIAAAKGGTFWPRLRRNLLWFAVGAATSYVARQHSR